MKYTAKNILSEGYVMGDALVLNQKSKDDVFVSLDFELIKLNHSINRTSDELNKMKKDNPDLNEYLETERLIAVDPILKKRVIDEIEKNKSAREAIMTVMNNYISDILKSTSEYLRERANDVRDIMNRLINNLGQFNEISDDDKYILVTDTLYPSLLIQRRNSILGVIAKNGGYTAHAAILCRSFDIPFVIADIECEMEETIIIDTRIKLINVNPTKAEKNKFLGFLNDNLLTSKVAISHSDEYSFLANVSNSFEVIKALEYNFDGVGLYRTEMIFMNSDRPATLLEQYSIYSEAVKIMKDKYVTFRTFDVGDDKKLSYLKTNKKGIDNYVQNPEIFEAQIKALLKANIYNNIKIMFPMIYANSEFEYLREWVIRIANENNYNIPPIGMMLETKDALNHIDEFKNPDFISIGTNDLAKDLYNIDREANVNIHEFSDKLINDIKPIVKYAKNRNIPLSVCGEIASIKDVAIKLYEIGIRNLSVSPSLIKMLNVSYDEFVNKK